MDRRLKHILMMLLAIAFSVSVAFAQGTTTDNTDVVTKQKHIEAIKLVERVIEELPAHLKSDASPIIASLYDEYLIHFLGQSVTQNDASTIPAVLRMTGEVNRYFNDLISQINASGVSVIDAKDLTAEMKSIINEKIRKINPKVIEMEKGLKKLRSSELESGQPYYIAKTTKDELIALTIPNELGGTIRVGAKQYVLTESVYNNYVGKQLLKELGYSVKDGGLFVATRSDTFKLEGTSVDDVKQAIDAQKNNKINNIRIKASKELINDITRVAGINSLVISVENNDVVGLKNLKINNIAPKELRCEKWVPQSVHPLHLTNGDVLPLLEEKGDQLLMYPYDSFEAVVDMVKFGAKDPNVKKIFITLYRTADGDEAEIVSALENAIKNGKIIEAIIEPRARGNEFSNFEIMRRLVAASEKYNAKDRVKIVYQAGGMKVHAKMIIFSRFDGRKYAYIPTGNLHEFTAGIYTDVGLFTADQKVINDLEVFAGNIHNTDVAPVFSSGKFFAAPWNLKTKLINLIKEQIQKGENGRIVIKANILTNPEIINVLKEAKQAGVKVDLIIRERSLANEELGVRSILGSFLEHMRIYQFGDGNDSKIYISSGDPSTEKLTMRYETFLEIDSPNVKNDLMDILNANLKDNRGAWIQGDDEYTKVEPDKSELSFGVQRYLRNKAGSKRYEGPEGLRTLLVDCAKNKWNLSTAYKNYPELFSKQNVEDFINLAGQQTTRSAGIDMLNKANFLIGQLAKNDQELESLKPLIGAVSANLVNTDVDILRARLEQYLGKKLDNIGDKQLVSDAAEMIISLNCNLNNSDLLTKILFGSIEDDYKDGVISLLSVMHANKNKINGLILLSIASNEKINLDGTMLEMSNYLGNIVDKNPIIRVAVDDIDAAGFDMIKGIDIKSGEMEKVFSVISKISEGASVLK